MKTIKIDYENFNYKVYKPVIVLYDYGQYIKYILDTFGKQLKCFIVYTPQTFPQSYYIYDSIGPFSLDIDIEVIFEKAFTHYQLLYNKLFSDAQEMIEFENPKRVLRIPRILYEDLRYKTSTEIMLLCDHKTLAGKPTYPAMRKKIISAIQNKSLAEDNNYTYILL